MTEDTRICTSCLERKPIAEFRWSERSTTCWPCVERAAERFSIDLGDDVARPLDLSVDLDRPARVCTGCADAKPPEAFPERGTLHGSLEGYFLCLTCRAIAPRLAKYGITLADFWAMFRAQNGCCAICLTPTAPVELRVDHCHITETVRGLLCHGCNVGIGWLGDDPARMRRAAEYVAASGAQSQLCVPGVS